MKKLHPVYEMSDEPIGVQMSEAQREKHLKKVRRALIRYMRRHPEVAPNHPLLTKKK